MNRGIDDACHTAGRGDRSNRLNLQEAIETTGRPDALSGFANMRINFATAIPVEQESGGA